MAILVKREVVQVYLIDLFQKENIRLLCYLSRRRSNEDNPTEECISVVVGCCVMQI
jgi:hypothetical protein